MELIRLENICKTYHLGEVDVPVLNGISFSIQRGELVALMGASGSGKSTLMNILGCLDRPSSGHYWLDGREVGQLGANERAIVRSQKLGFVFQSFNLLSRTTATSNVAMPLDYSVKPISAAAAANRASELLIRVGLSHRLDHMPSQMSGGQQQRVAIARSLINQPSLVLADEPTGNLDSHTSVEILEMFRQLNETGITVLLVTHDPQVAEYADRIIHIVDGLIDSDTRMNRPPVNGPHFGNGDGQSNGNGNGNGHARVTQRTAVVAGHATTAAAGQTAVATKVRPMAATAAADDELEETSVDVPAMVARKHGTRRYRNVMGSLFPTTLRTAVNALRRNKMRSALTTLGIIIGVGAVIAMVEISQGSKTALMQTMSSMGANNLIVQSGAAASGGISFGQGSEKTLTPEDADQIRAQCEDIAAVAPIVEIRGQVVRGNHNWTPMNIYGTVPEYLVCRDWNSMEAGDMFTDQDVRGSLRTCVIGTTVARELFPDESPLGKDIRVQNVALRVMGVLSKKGANMMGMDQDDVVLAPWTTVKFRISGNNAGGASGGTTASSNASTSSISTDTKTLNNIYPTTSVQLYPQQSSTQQLNNPQRVMFVNVDQIHTKAASADAIPAAIQQITALLRERHHLRSDEVDDFNIRDLSELLRNLSSTSRMMGMLLLIVAMI